MTARLPSPLVLAALLAFCGSSAFAQGARSTPAPAKAPETATAPAAAPGVDPATGELVETAPATKTKDAKIEHLVTEDSQVRIEVSVPASSVRSSACAVATSTSV